ncbi:MAG: DNA polymerase I [Syntrophomonadaceae bacterium]|nr:DNA polymerase I [Bacillota bacterium]
MNIEINRIPTIEQLEGKSVCLDLEMFEQDKDKLHIPHGKFAGLAVVLEDANFWITDVKLLPELFSSLYFADGWVLQNALYDLVQLRALVDIVPHPVFDIMIIEQNMWGGYYSEFNLKAMTRRYFNVIMQKDKYESLRDSRINANELAEYAVMDARNTLRIFEEQKKIITPETWKVYTEIDGKTIWAILYMGRPTIDAEAWMDNATIMEQKVRSIEEEIGLNTKSFPQVRDFMQQTFDEVFTSCNNETLVKYSNHSVVAKIIEGRMYRTASATFGRKWLVDNLLPDNTVQSSWQVCEAMTGRMSSRKPNLQNIPMRKMPQFRDYFIAKPGHKYIVADVSQQEPRILACLSKDKGLIRAFTNKEDVHLAVTREIFHDPIIVEDDPRRKIGKEINLGTSYGLTGIGLAAQLGIEIEEAEQFIAAYFNKFPGIKRYIDSYRAAAFKKEKVFTPYGRCIHINIHSDGWENNAINNPIQGGAADMTKLWKVKLFELCHQYKLEYPVIMVIHDELVLQVLDEKVDGYIILLTEAFNQTINTIFPDAPIPFEFEYKVGDRWSVKL